MSRWNELFEKHAFREAWASVIANLENAKLDDESVITSSQELGRLRKLVSYIDGLLDSMDAELIPLSMLDNFNTQAVACSNEIAAFNLNKNIVHIQNANANVDNLLTYVRPYMVVGGRTAKALRHAASAYSDSFAQNAKSFSDKVGNLLEAAKANVNELEEDKAAIRTIREQLAGVRDEFIGADGVSGVYHDLAKKIEEFKEEHAELDALYDDFFVGEGGSEAKKLTLKNAIAQAVTQSGKAQSIVEGANATVREIEAFRAKIFGGPEETESPAKGLSHDLDQQKARLDQFEEQQRTRYNALNAQIESLLPGATSAGLATAYREMKDSFAAPIRTATNIFYVAIAVLMLGSFLFFVKSIGLTGIKFDVLGDWESVLRSIAYKLPFYGPAVWLAYFASKRRSEFQRLQQEYAHKESLAKSYDSYRKQVLDLDLPDSSMLASLMEKAIDAISHNASQTLDGRHGDKMPVQSALENLADMIAERRSSQPG